MQQPEASNDTPPEFAKVISEDEPLTATWTKTRLDGVTNFAASSSVMIPQVKCVTAFIVPEEGRGEHPGKAQNFVFGATRPKPHTLTLRTL